MEGGRVEESLMESVLPVGLAGTAFFTVGHDEGS
jgi:hypothetical protein